MEKIRSKLFKRSNPKATAASNSSDANQSDNGLTFEYFQNQFLLDCVLRIPSTERDHDEMIAFCYGQIDNNREDLRVLKALKESYSSDRALWWYLRESFFYKILNYSLESADLRNLYLFRGILRDLQEIFQRHRSPNALHVYRSQLMPMELLDRWISSVGQCVTVNSFLSATLSQEVALTFLNSEQAINENFERVLMEIDADPRVLGARPFVHLNSFDYAADKNEVIFLFGSIFLLNNITCTNDGIYRVELTLYTDLDQDLKNVFDELRSKHLHSTLDHLHFAQILFDFDRLSEAEEYAHRHLEQLPSDHPDQRRSSHLLGAIALGQHQYENSLKWYEKALEFDQRRSNRLEMAEDHECLANVYSKKADFDPAVKHCSAALDIKQELLPAQDPSIGQTLERLAMFYEMKGDLLRARSAAEKAFAIYRRSSTISTEKLRELEQTIRRLSSR